MIALGAVQGLESGHFETMSELINISRSLDDQHAWGMISDYADEIGVAVERARLSAIIPAIALTILTIAHCAIETALVWQCDDALSAIHELLSFLPPELVVRDEELMDFIGGRLRGQENIHMRPAQSVLWHCTTGMIVVDEGHVIQNVNPEIRNLVGYTGDQLLGRQVD